MRNLRPLLGLCLLLLLVASARARLFTSTDGKTIDAEVLTVNDTHAVLKRGIKQYNVPLDRLSAADQEYLAEWRTKELVNRIPKLDVQINTGKSNRSDKRDSFDDRIGSFQFSLTIENEENGYVLEKGTAVLSVLGENCDADNMYCIMQKTTFPVSLEDGGVFEWEGDEKAYRFDDRPPSYWGHEYYGFVFQLKNAAGTVIYQKVNPSRFEDGVEKILGLSSGTAFDKDFRERGRASIYDL